MLSSIDTIIIGTSIHVEKNTLVYFKFYNRYNNNRNGNRGQMNRNRNRNRQNQPYNRARYDNDNFQRHQSEEERYYNSYLVDSVEAETDTFLY